MIKLVELIHNYRLFCDMDGVLTDFDLQFSRISGITPVFRNTSAEKKLGSDKFWSIIDNAGVKFWSDMP